MNNKFTIVYTAVFFLLIAGCGNAGKNSSNKKIYSVSISITGLKGNNLLLRINDDAPSELKPTPDVTEYTFSYVLVAGQIFELSVVSNPTGPIQRCVFSNPFGQIRAENISNTPLTCSSFSVKLPISIDVSKRAETTTLDVRTFIVDSETDGDPVIVGFNDITKAIYGEVAYNGNGTFTYTPGPDIITGSDSFSFVAQNSAGSRAQGLVTLNIPGGWSPNNDLVNAAQLEIIDARRVGPEYITEYSSNQKIFVRKFDAVNDTWLDPILVGNRNGGLVTDPASGGMYNTHLKFDHPIDQTIVHIVNTATSPSVKLSYIEVDLKSNSVLPSVVDGETLTEVNIQYQLESSVRDDSGNIMLIFLKIPINVQAGVGSIDIIGKLFNATTGQWEASNIIISSAIAGNRFMGAAGSSAASYFVNGQFMVVVSSLDQKQLPKIFTYNTGNTWNVVAQLLSTKTLVPAINNPIKTTAQSIQNDNGDVLITWVQAEDVAGTVLKANVYRANPPQAQTPLAGELSLESIVSTTSSVNIYHSVNKPSSDFLVIWKVIVGRSCTGGIWTYADNLAKPPIGGNFDPAKKVTIKVPLSGSICSAALPVPISDELGNIFTSWSDGSRSFFNYKPQGGIWGSQDEIGTSITNIYFVKNSFDQLGNIYLLFPDIVPDTFSIRKFRFNTPTVSPQIIASDASMGKPDFTYSTNNDIYVHWSRLTAESTPEYCIKKLINTATFSDASLSAEECLFKGSVGTTWGFRIYDNLGQRYAFLTGTTNSLFSTQTGNSAWNPQESIFSAERPLLSPSPFIYQYGAGSRFDFLYLSGGNSKKIIHLLYD